MFLHALHIHFQSSQEHDIIESYPTKQFKGVVTHQDIETILADHHACQHRYAEYAVYSSQ